MKFGWSLPPGCGKLPGEDEPDGNILCPECGGIITNYSDGVQPARAEPWEDWVRAPESDEYGNMFVHGPFRGEGETREALMAAGTVLYWKCPNCGCEVKESQ